MGLGRSLRAVVGQFSAADAAYADDDAFAGPVDFETGDEAQRRGHGGSADFDEIYRDAPLRHSHQDGQRAGRPLAIVRPPRIEFSLVAPHDFADAQHIADRLRADSPVIVDLQSCGRDLAERLIDFCSGLTYALGGRLEDVAENVILLAPHDLELSSAALGCLHARRFFNQV